MRKARASVAMHDLDLLGEAPVVTGRVSSAGRSRVPLRVMIALLSVSQARLQRVRRGSRAYAKQWLGFNRTA